MKRIVSILTVLILTITALQAQRIELPLPSPGGEVEQMIGLTEVEISYSRPGVKGRVIWGDLVPYDKLWRTGANAATLIEFDDDVKVNGQDVPEGTYALLTIPGKTEWTVILNKDASLRGTGNYDEAKDQLRFKVTPQPYAAKTETMTFEFANIKDNQADVVLRWDELMIGFTVSVDTKANALEAMNSTNNAAWSNLARSAKYCLDNDMELEKANQWIDQSVALKESFYNTWIKGQLLAKAENYKEAVKWIEKSQALGEAEGDKGSYRFYKEEIAAHMMVYQERTGKKKKKK